MANHEIALSTFLNTGLRQRGLEGVLASNCVLDWFGRTLTGRSRVINYYFNSNNCYEHSMSNAETIEAFEERSTHLSTRDQPLDNLQKPPELSGDEQWYDCETHSPVNLKDSHKTPPVRSNHLQKCPPAPCRRSLLNNSSSDEEKPASPDDSFEDEFKPLDGSIQYTKTEKIVRSPESKRPRLGDLEGEKKSDTISLEQSRYSDLHYCEVSGAVTIRRQASSSSSRDESDRRECKLQISYRVNKDSANDIQIALIVYKNNSQVRSRRNLMQQFKGDEETSIVQTELSTPSIRCQSTDKIIYTAPAGTQNVSKTMKRSSSSRNCLRF